MQFHQERFQLHRATISQELQLGLREALVPLLNISICGGGAISSRLIEISMPPPAVATTRSMFLCDRARVSLIFPSTITQLNQAAQRLNQAGRRFHCRNLRNGLKRSRSPSSRKRK